MATVISNKTQKPISLCVTAWNGVIDAKPISYKTIHIGPLSSYVVKTEEEDVFKDYVKTDTMKMMLDKGYLAISDKPLKFGENIVKVESPKPPEELATSPAQERLGLQYGLGIVQPNIQETMQFPSRA